MYIFYTLEQIENFSIFSSFDFSSLTDFESMMILLSVNVFYLLFLGFSITIIYKTVSRLYNAIF